MLHSVPSAILSRDGGSMKTSVLSYTSRNLVPRCRKQRSIVLYIKNIDQTIYPSSINLLLSSTIPLLLLPLHHPPVLPLFHTSPFLAPSLLTLTSQPPALQAPQHQHRRTNFPTPTNTSRPSKVHNTVTTQAKTVNVLTWQPSVAVRRSQRSS